MSNQFKTTKKFVPIDLIVPNKWNPNVQNKEMFEKGKKSVEELGMLGSILVREIAGHYEILDGEHRWKYGKELGYTEMPVETMGEISDDEAKLLTILINNVRGKDDIEKRAKILQQLNDGQLSLLPFTEQQIKFEKELISFDFSQYDKQIPIERVAKKLVHIVLSDDEYAVWQKCLAEGKKEDKEEIQVLVEMMESFLALRMGASVGQRTQAI